MYLYINKSTGQYGLSIHHVRQCMPNVSVPTDIPVAGVFERYELVPPPAVTVYQRFRELPPKDGKQQWEVINLSPQEINEYHKSRVMMKKLEREGILRDTLWTQLPDSPLSVEQRKLWADYRNKLRELFITSDTVFPPPPKD